MESLLIYLVIMFICYLISRKLGDKREKFAFISTLTSLLVYAMVFIMGLRMGSNEEVTAGLTTIGLQATLITLMTVAGSMIFAVLVRKILHLNKYGLKEVVNSNNLSKVGAGTVEDNEAGEPKENGLKSSLIIVIVVIAGMLVGYLAIPKIFENLADFEELSSLGLSVCLCLLLAFVGFDLGKSGNIGAKFKSIGLKALLMPLAIIVGTLSAAAIFSLFSDMTLRECLAIGAGFGWYSLAPGVIMEAGHVTASAVSFLHNVMREMFAILVIPAVANKIGYFEATAIPGAPGMDVCLPIVEKSTNGEMAIYSLISGLILSLLVPVLVPFIIG